MDEQTRRAARPGGRSARTKAETFEAVAGLILERGHGAITMADVAERAGLAATSLYRRWGDVQTLILEVAVDRLMRERPLPDTGSLPGDLKAWARRIASSLRGRGKSSFFAALISTALSSSDDKARNRALEPRAAQIRAMLVRAQQRGEKAPSFDEVMNFLLSPLYMRALLGEPATERMTDELVERLLGG